MAEVEDDRTNSSQSSDSDEVNEDLDANFKDDDPNAAGPFHPKTLLEAWTLFATLATTTGSAKDRAEFLARVSASGYAGYYARIQAAQTTPILSFKTRTYNKMLDQLMAFFLDPESNMTRASSTNKTFCGHMRAIAHLCVVQVAEDKCPHITNPGVFAKAIEGRKNVIRICAVVESRAAGIEWDTPTGRPTDNPYIERDWDTDPPPHTTRENMLWERLCLAVEQPGTGVRPSKTKYPIYARRSDGSTGPRAWFRYDFSASARLAVERIVEVDADDAVPAWLRNLDAPKHVRSLGVFIDAHSTVGANPEERNALYLFVMCNTPAVPPRWGVQAYVGETAETTTGRWFKARANCHLKAAQHAIKLARTPGAARPPGTILVDLTIACAWAEKRMSKWWYDNTRLYVLSSGESEQPQAERDNVREDTEKAYIEQLELTHMARGMNNKGKKC